MRQRVRAIRAAPDSPPVQIGIRMTRTGRSAARPAVVTGGGVITGPHIGDLGDCRWIFWLSGTSANDIITWAASWDGSAENPGYIEFGTAFNATDPLQYVYMNTTSVENLIVYATVNGTVYASDPISCAF